MDRFSFLDCDGDRFEEEQCRSNLICYCVDEVTGDRTSNRTYTRREVESGEPCKLYVIQYMLLCKVM